MTPIKPIPNKPETKKFGNELVQDFWLEPEDAVIPGQSVTDYNYMDQLKAYLESDISNGVICVFSEELSSNNLCESLAKARDNDNRIYILTNNYKSEMKNLEGCLIRYGGSKRIGSFILINPNSNNPSGLVFTGRLSNASIDSPVNFLLDLDNNQITALFRYFCYQFWNKAEKERIGQNERPSVSGPLDIYPPAEDSCDFEYLKSIWGKETKNASLFTSLLDKSPYLQFNNYSNSTIVTLLSEIDASTVRLLKQKNNKIFALDGDSLINLVETPNGFWLIPKIDVQREEEIYAVLLNETQKSLFAEHIPLVLSGKKLNEYFASETRENLKGKTIFHLDNAIQGKYTINEESICKPGDVSPSTFLPKDELEKLKPDFPDDNRSISITYEWAIIPFTLPNGSKRHPLYKNWEDAGKTIIESIDGIQNNIKKSKSGLSKLLGFFILRKEQKFSGYQNDLDELKKIKYSYLEETALQEKISKINEIRASVEKDGKEISEEQRKAQLREDIKKNENDKKTHETDLVEKRNSLKEIEDAIHAQSDIMEKNKSEADTQNRKNDEKKELTNEASDKKKELEDQLNNEQKKLDTLNSKKNGIETEIRSLENKIKNITGEIKRLNSQLENPVKEQEKTNKSNPHSGELAVPPFPRLPSKGELYRHNEQDYLAIIDWEDYDKGQEEAKRLKAKLCSKGDNIG